MTRKALVLAALSLACTSATQSGIPPEARPAVVKVECMVGAGSAFRIGPHLLASVNHVTSLGGCFIDGKRFKALGTQGDFSLLSMDETAPSSLEVDCGGFVEGRKYQAIGFARGLDTLTTVDLTATGNKIGQFSILRGVFTVIPGMSGGAVIDAETGKVVGTVNIYEMVRGLSGSVALRDTSVCRG